MKKPAAIDPLAEQILQQLSRRPEASEIILGGYFALQHYVDYRRTYDIDAWWRLRASLAAEQAIRQVTATVAAENHLEFRERRFGETISFELLTQGKKRFSFQIAVRSVGLEEPVESAWPPILIETLSDNIGSKMNALVDRGSPRDFTDVKHVIDAGLKTVLECWQLWSRKNPTGDSLAAKQNVLIHLAAIEARRPLHAIADSTERERARLTREWFRQSFLER